jgi:hypothetical protein
MRRVGWIELPPATAVERVVASNLTRLNQGFGETSLNFYIAVCVSPVR